MFVIDEELFVVVRLFLVDCMRIEMRFELINMCG